MLHVITFILFWDGRKRCPHTIESLLFEGAHASLTFQTRLNLATFTENFLGVLSLCTPSTVKLNGMYKISFSL